MSATEANAAFEYVGAELPLFALASNWKAYWRRQIAPYIRGDVLEVGAGLGVNTRLLSDLEYQSWTCLEPDASLLGKVQLPSARHCAVAGVIDALEADRKFDSILYIDVLEHIEDDAEELLRARDRLRPGGWLMVLSPAHPFLYTPFDRAIGHYRRYTRKSLRQAAPAGLLERRMVYLDSAGLLASAGNRLLLGSAMPTKSQILFWDRVLVPVSRLLDPTLGWNAGKTVIGVWERAA